MSRFAAPKFLRAPCAAVLVAALALAGTARGQCVADCNGDGEVVIGELITAVNIAIGARPVADCRAADPNADGEIGINELIGAVNDALDGCEPVQATATPTATPTATEEATPTELPVGPEIVFFGLTAPDDVLIGPSAEEDGVPVFELPQGRAFHIVVEAGLGSSAIGPGIDTFSMSGPPSFQILSSNPLGNGSSAVCDAEPPSAGGVPAVSPPSFEDVPMVVDALNDLGCRFQDGGGTDNPITSGRGCGVQSACVRFEDAMFGCVSERALLQYCSTDVSVIEEFPPGDTLLTARVLEAAGERRPGPAAQIIIRVTPPFP